MMDDEKIKERANKIGGTAGRPDYVANLIDRAKKLPDNCRVLEVGAQHGGSAVTIGLVIKDKGGVIYSVEPGFIPIKDRPSEYTLLPVLGDLQAYLHNAALNQLEGHMIPLPGTSREVLDRWDGRLFNMIYIDGDHTYESVKIDLEWCKYTRIRAYLALDDWIIPVKAAVDEYMVTHSEWELATETIPRLYRKRKIL